MARVSTARLGRFASRRIWARLIDTATKISPASAAAAPAVGGEQVVPGGGLVSGHPGPSAARTASTCSPYLASLLSPMPVTAPSPASEPGRVAAISRRVASWKIT